MRPQSCWAPGAGELGCPGARVQAAVPFGGSRAAGRSLRAGSVGGARLPEKLHRGQPLPPPGTQGAGQCQHCIQGLPSPRGVSARTTLATRSPPAGRLGRRWKPAEAPGYRGRADGPLCMRGPGLKRLVNELQPSGQE